MLNFTPNLQSREIKETVPFDFNVLYDEVQREFQKRGYDSNFHGSNISQITTLISYAITMLNAQTATNINETILPLAKDRKNILQAARVLGYEIRHKTSFRYKIRLKPKTVGIHTLRKYTKFNLGGRDFYYTDEDILVNCKTYDDVINTSLTIEIKEGNLIKKELGFETEYIMDGVHSYIDIPYTDIEENGIDVYVSMYLPEGGVIENELWTKHNLLTLDTKDSLKNKFIRMDNIETNTPRLFFKVAEIGETLLEGTKVEIVALQTNGSKGEPSSLDLKINSDFANSFVIDSSFQPVIVSRGSDEETDENIKNNAPLVNNTASRVVTASDHKTILKTHHSVLDAVCWGGEDELPFKKGQLIYSIIPSELRNNYSVFESGIRVGDLNSNDNSFVDIRLNDPFSNSRYIKDEFLFSKTKNLKKDIVNPGVLDVINNYKLPSLKEYIKNPVYFYYDLWVDVKKYDVVENQVNVRKNIFNTIKKYANNIQKFDSCFIKSNFTKLIDDSLTDIMGIELKPKFYFTLSKDNITKSIRKTFELNSLRCFYHFTYVDKEKLLFMVKVFIPESAKVGDSINLFFNKKIFKPNELRGDNLNKENIVLNEKDISEGYIFRTYDVSRINNLSRTSLRIQVKNVINWDFEEVTELTQDKKHEGYIPYSYQITNYLHKTIVGLPEFCEEGDLITIIPEWVKDLKLGEKIKESSFDLIERELNERIKTPNLKKYISKKTFNEYFNRDVPSIMVDFVTFKSIENEVYRSNVLNDTEKLKKFKERVTKEILENINKELNLKLDFDDYDLIIDVYENIKIKMSSGELTPKEIEVDDKLLDENERLRKIVAKNETIKYYITFEDLEKGYVEISRAIKGVYAGISKPLKLSVEYTHKPFKPNFLLNMKVFEVLKDLTTPNIEYNERDIDFDAVVDETVKQNIDITKRTDDTYYFKVIEGRNFNTITIFLPKDINGKIRTNEGDKFLITDYEDTSYKIEHIITNEEIKEEQIKIEVERPLVELIDINYNALNGERVECFPLHYKGTSDYICEEIKDDRVSLLLEENIYDVKLKPVKTSLLKVGFIKSNIVELLYNHKNRFDLRNLVENIHLIDPENNSTEELTKDYLKKIKYRVKAEINKTDNDIGIFEGENENLIYFNYITLKHKSLTIPVMLFEKEEIIQTDSYYKDKWVDVKSFINIKEKEIKQITLTPNDTKEKERLDKIYKWFSDKSKTDIKNLYCDLFLEEFATKEGVVIKPYRWSLVSRKDQFFNFINSESLDSHTLNEGEGGIYAYLSIPYEGIYTGKKLDTDKLPKIDTRNIFGGKDIIVDFSINKNTLKYNFPFRIDENYLDDIDMRDLEFIKFPIYAVEPDFEGSNSYFLNWNEKILLGTYMVVNDRLPYIRLKFRNILVNHLKDGENLVFDLRYPSDNFNLERNSYLMLKNVYFDTGEALERDKEKLFLPEIPEI